MPQIVLGSAASNTVDSPTIVKPKYFDAHQISSHQP
jgi:hypothetical protein